MAQPNSSSTVHLTSQPPHTATQMSYSHHSPRLFSGTWTASVRNLLVMVAVMNTAACLVVDSPDFSDESRGAPQLTAVLPMTELIKVLPNSNLPTFTATVVSEDAGSDLLTSLLIDYGVAAETAHRGKLPWWGRWWKPKRFWTAPGIFKSPGRQGRLRPAATPSPCW